MSLEAYDLLFLSCCAAQAVYCFMRSGGTVGLTFFMADSKCWKVIGLRAEAETDTTAATEPRSRMGPYAASRAKAFRSEAE